MSKPPITAFDLQDALTAIRRAEFEAGEKQSRRFELRYAPNLAQNVQTILGSAMPPHDTSNSNVNPLQTFTIKPVPIDDMEPDEWALVRIGR